METNDLLNRGANYTPSNDVEVALMFFLESDRDLTLAVESALSIPYVKRTLYRLLGMPTKTYGDALWYGKRLIRVVKDDAKYWAGVNYDLLFKVDTWEEGQQ